ncbi:MAG: transporter substrate-binding domain-containing protein [Pseudomonadaceae bacterium]|jgi:polar amino acid transport system substrate-binding protein|nr:transporter substrate-binding domain-containing protein [Pseudomonadaceae bacterium]
MSPKRLLLMTLVFACCSSVGQAQLRLGTQELPPYSFTNEQGQLDGVAVHVVRCALDAAQVPYEIGVWPWARVQLMVQRNDLDGFFAASYAEEREIYAALSEVIAPQQWRWYLLKDSTLDPSSPEFKQEARVTAYIGTNMLNWMLEKGYKVQSAPARQEQLLEMLKFNRVDAVLANNLVMEKIISDTGQQDKVRSVLQQDKPLGVYFSKNYLKTHPDLLDRFNAQVAGCRERFGLMQ